MTGSWTPVGVRLHLVCDGCMTSVVTSAGRFILGTNRGSGLVSWLSAVLLFRCFSFGQWWRSGCLYAQDRVGVFGSSDFQIFGFSKRYWWFEYYLKTDDEELFYICPVPLSKPCVIDVCHYVYFRHGTRCCLLSFGVLSMAPSLDSLRSSLCIAPVVRALEVWDNLGALSYERKVFIAVSVTILWFWSAVLKRTVTRVTPKTRINFVKKKKIVYNFSVFLIFFFVLFSLCF